jgi:group II intron reverse transcriptase/maturase
VTNGLLRVREAARREKRARFTALLHHVTIDLLRESFFALKRQAAPGVDGVTWEQYEVDLEERLRDLKDRVHRGAYRAQPSKRTYIPKTDGRMRPIGIAALEDKIVQQAVVSVLTPIYEEDFLGFSYGFRPGRSQHDALDALWVGITDKKVNWVLDADIQGFFDTLDHGWLSKFLEHRIADRRILRLIRKWLRAGVSEEGGWSKTTVGVPQGAVISPMLGNVYLHYVLDHWAYQWRNRHARGDMIVVRYCDDFVMGFQYRSEAERLLQELRERLKVFGLVLHPDKTRLIEFGRFAASNRKKRGQGRPETFDFLGFTHACGTKKNGGFYLKRKTIAKRLRAKLRHVKETLMRHRHKPVQQQGAWLRRVVQGYFNYHAVPGNRDGLNVLRTQITRHWLRALRRRSQKHRMNWERFSQIVDHWIPHARNLHPYPGERFYAIHPR